MIAPNIFRPRNDWNIISFRCKKPVQFDRFEKMVADAVQQETGVNPLKYRHYRGGKVVQSRQVFLVMMVNHTKRTYDSIAGIVEKDHSTINNCIKSVQNMRDTDKRFSAMYDRIDAKIKLIK
jgi:hypothetical protein